MPPPHQPPCCLCHQYWALLGRCLRVSWPSIKLPVVAAGGAGARSLPCLIQRPLHSQIAVVILRAPKGTWTLRAGLGVFSVEGALVPRGSSRQSSGAGAGSHLVQNGGSAGGGGLLLAEHRRRGVGVCKEQPLSGQAVPQQLSLWSPLFPLQREGDSPPAGPLRPALPAAAAPGLRHQQRLHQPALPEAASLLVLVGGGLPRPCPCGLVRDLPLHCWHHPSPGGRLEYGLKLGISWAAVLPDPPPPGEIICRPLPQPHRLQLTSLAGSLGGCGVQPPWQGPPDGAQQQPHKPG